MNPKTKKPDTLQKRFLGSFVHACRVTVLLIIVWLIYDTELSRRIVDAETELDVRQDVITSVFDSEAKIATNGVVYDAQGTPQGRFIQTSPICDYIVGFSGPTNVLIAVDNANRIIDVRILESKDTKEHIQQVVEDEHFLSGFIGKNIQETDEFATIDAVSGATLTSLAITESLIHRLGGGLGSLKFPDPPSVELAQKLFQSATELKQVGDGRWEILSKTETLGHLQSTAPAADQIVGYQGPTESFLGFDPDAVLQGIVIRGSYDNEPYVGYVREDTWFPKLFEQKSAAELSELDLETVGVEGVSGATMTSMAVADAIVAASAEFESNNLDDASANNRTLKLTTRDYGTVAVFLSAIAIGFSRLRGKKWIRLPFQAILIIYLGFINCDILSQALLVGWAQHGIPWQTMFGMTLLTAAAFALPILTKRNVYCHQICPHGAAQQWLRPSKSRKIQVPRKLDQWLSLLPALLLVVVLLTAMGAISVNLVGIEPFDAYVIGIGGAATIAIAIVGLASSAFVPMAYCKYGCPTGAILEFTRRHRKSEVLGRRDFFAIACMALAILLRFSSQ